MPIAICTGSIQAEIEIEEHAIRWTTAAGQSVDYNNLRQCRLPEDRLIFPEVTTNPFVLVAIAIVSYLLGTIAFGVFFTNIMRLGDLRNIGSGNIGATNVLRTGNKFAAALTLVCDFAKGCDTGFCGKDLRWRRRGANCRAFRFPWTPLPGLVSFPRRKRSGNIFGGHRAILANRLGGGLLNLVGGSDSQPARVAIVARCRSFGANLDFNIRNSALHFRVHGYGNSNIGGSPNQHFEVDQRKRIQNVIFKPEQARLNHEAKFYRGNSLTSAVFQERSISRGTCHRSRNTASQSIFESAERHSKSSISIACIFNFLLCREIQYEYSS